MTLNTLKITIVMIFLSLSTLAFAWTGPQGVTFKTTQEFQTTVASGFTASEPWNSVWHQGNNTYFVWVDANYRPWVTQITNGSTVTTVPIDTGTDYTVQADGHHRFSIGVDTSGYIHVTGDMHNYINQTTAVLKPYVARYQKQTILYWKSNTPNSVSGGFTFAGGLNAPTAIPGNGWMMGRFFADNNGVLYYASNVQAYQSDTNAGQQAVGLYVYNTTSKTWTAIGNTVNNGGQPYTTSLIPVFYWELAGLATNDWFQNYEPSFKFDTNNRLHFSVSGTTITNGSGANRLIYAYSDNGGVTWKKANGTVIPSLPIRGAAGQASVGDVVADSGTTTNFFGPQIGLIVDKLGQQGISVAQTPSTFNNWFSWTGSAWNMTSNDLNSSIYPDANFGYRTNDNNLVLNVTTTAKLLFGTSLDAPVYGYDLAGYNTYTNVDEYSALHYGLIYGIGFNNSVESVLVSYPVAAPLPATWACADISNPAPLYGGTCGYVNNTFVSTNYQKGVNWGGTTDNYYFIYKQMSGNFTLVSQVSSTPASAGLMIRNSLSPTDVNAALIIGSNNSVGLNSRAQAGTQALSHNRKFNLRSASTAISWLKLVRVGNVVTGYSSTDGVTWSKYEAVTIPLANSVYVGLVSSSGQDGWFIQNSTFSNVTLG